MTRHRLRLVGLLAALTLAASGAGAAAASTVPAAGILPAAVGPDGETCTLSEPHAVAGDFVSASSTFARIQYGAATRIISPTDSRYHEVAQGSSVTNQSTGHTFYEAEWLIGHMIAQRGNTATRYTSTYNGAGTFVGDVAPTAPFVPLANPTVHFTPIPNTVLPNLGTRVYSEVIGAPLSGTLSGIPVTIAPSAAVPAYRLGDIAVGATIPTRITAQIDRAASGSFGWQTSDLIVARTCLPEPTIDSWVSGSGLTPISGTGDYAGDEITVRDSNGAVIGTATVQTDLTWTLIPSTPLPAGTTALVAMETDEFGFEGDSESGTAQVVSPSIEIVKLINDVDVSEAPGPELLEGETVRWTYIVRNSGDADLAEVSVADEGSDGSSPTVSCPSATLGAGASMTCTASAEVSAAAYSNIATAVGLPVDSDGQPIQSTVQVSFEDSSWYTGVTGDLSVLKLADKTDVSTQGEEIVFSFDVRNNGTGTATEVAVVDTLIAGSGDAPEVLCPADELGAGESMVCSATYTATSADLARGYIDNAAVVIGTIGGATVESDQSIVTVTATGPTPSPEPEPSSGGASADPLAQTGAEASLPWIVAGFAFVLAGAVSSLFALRRRRS